MTIRAIRSIRARLLDTKLMGSARSAMWTLGERLLRLCLGLVVGIWLARYLGPDQYGKYNYALAWVGIFNAIAWLGVGETLLRDFVRQEDRTNVLLGTALALRLAGSVAAASLAVITFLAIAPAEHTVLVMVVIFALAVPFAEAPAGIFLWYQSRMRLGAAVMLVNCIRIAAAAGKIALIAAASSVVAFAWVSFFEAVLISAALFGLYAVQGHRVSAWRTTFAEARSMFVSGLPLILSALVTSVSARVDQLLIGWLLDFHQVGLYVAATRFSEIWWAIPPLLMNALAPHYIFPSGIGDRLIRNVTLIGAAMIVAGLVPCLVLALVGGPLLDVLLGSQYAGAAPILIVHVWIAVFVFVDLPVVHYLLATGRQNVLFAKSAVVLTVNTLLALALIPELGAVGAAVALLAAQAIATTAFYYLHPSTREVLGIHLRMLQIIVRGSSGVVRVIRRR